MHVKVTEIPPEGLDLELCEDLSIEGVALAGSSCGQFRWRRLGERIIVEGTVRAEAVFSCARCLAEFVRQVEAPFSLQYEPRAVGAGLGVEEELETSDLDVSYYDGTEIDAGQILREQVILGMPMNPVCNETCKGICDRCGADLNSGPCECGETATDSRFSVLSQLKEKK